MHGSSKVLYSKEEIKRAFDNVAGEAPTGCAEIASVEDHVMRWHPNREEAIEAIKALRTTADGDGNGYFNFNEFVDMIMQDDIAANDEKGKHKKGK